MARKYSSQLLEKLKQAKIEKDKDGFETVLKPIPDGDAPGAMDPRLYRSMRLPMLLMRFMPKKKNASMQDQLLNMRKMFNGVKSHPMTRSDTKIENVFADYNGNKVPLRVYTPAAASSSEKLPVLYYIHGGGFFAGSPDVVEEASKYFAETYPCIVVSVTYRLAPENPYPAGHEDCYEGLRWVYQNIEDFGGDQQKIFVSGDSAGGNLANYCSMRDRDEASGMVKMQALYYPTVNMAGVQDEYFKPGKQNYTVDKKSEKIVYGMLDMLGGEGFGAFSDLLKVDDINIPCLNPYTANLSGLPPTLILVGEFDFLYPECVAYSKKLKMAGVETKTIVYRGLSHAFLDNMGKFPQAEDSVLEVIAFAKSHID